MKNVLVLISILFLSFNVLAKSPGKTQGKSKANVSSKKYAKDAFKFDLRVYYKLKFPDRKKYLMAYVDFIRAVNSELQAKHEVELNLMRLLFPTADAQYGVDHCYTGGIYYPLSESVSGSCGSGYKSTYFPEQLKAAFSGCTNNNRCAAYFGVDSSNNGFCFQTEGNATTECLNQSSPEAIDRLNQLLANKYDAKAIALQKAIELDLRNNNLIAKYCLDKTDKGGKCAKLSSTVAEFKNKIQSPTSSSITAGNDQNGKGCAQAEIDAINAATGKAKIADRGDAKKVSPIWYKMLTMGAQGACPGGVFYDELVQKVGVCKQFSLSETPDVEADVRNNDALRDAINVFSSGGTVAKGDQWRTFTNYFGVNPEEFKKVICAKDTATARVETLGVDGDPKKPGLLPNTFGGSGEQFTKRRNQFKSCIADNIKLEPDSKGESKWRSNADKNTCHFQQAFSSNKIEDTQILDMIDHPEKYKGKYYFADNTTGNCYSLEKATRTCNNEFASMQERSANSFVCPTGSGALEDYSYFRLSPVHQTGYSDPIMTAKNFKQRFTAFRMDCGSAATAPCNADNDYCREGDSSADR